MNEIEEPSSTDDETLSYFRHRVVRRVYYNHCKCATFHNEHHWTNHLIAKNNYSGLEACKDCSIPRSGTLRTSAVGSLLVTSCSPLSEYSKLCQSAQDFTQDHHHLCKFFNNCSCLDCWKRVHLEGWWQKLCHGLGLRRNCIIVVNCES